MCNSSLDPGLEKQNYYTRHYWDNWQNLNTQLVDYGITSMLRALILMGVLW